MTGYEFSHSEGYTQDGEEDIRAMLVEMTEAERDAWHEEQERIARG